MKSIHKLFFKNSKEMSEIKDKSIDLVVTSPPYPMIKMWDELFSSQNRDIEKAIKNNDAKTMFALMHKELDMTWNECYRVLKEGGIACINIGDATRTIDETFRIFPNHARILTHCLELGFHALPSILWVKETNKPDKFMGSGTLPVGAYVTLEHEHILILRKGRKRVFNSSEIDNRQISAFFWEERNNWFSDKWKDINGVFQNTNDKSLRERTGAYPFELAYRLINMYSVMGDTVLDPFLGTGTTTLAAMASARNSVGYEIDANFKPYIEERIKSCVPECASFNKLRIKNHLQFIEEQKKKGNELKNYNPNYKFDVVTRQETKLAIPIINDLQKIGEHTYSASYA